MFFWFISPAGKFQCVPLSKAFKLQIRHIKDHNITCPHHSHIRSEQYCFHWLLDAGMPRNTTRRTRTMSTRTSQGTPARVRVTRLSLRRRTHAEFRTRTRSRARNESFSHCDLWSLVLGCFGPWTLRSPAFSHAWSLSTTNLILKWQMFDGIFKRS